MMARRGSRSEGYVGRPEKTNGQTEQQLERTEQRRFLSQMIRKSGAVEAVEIAADSNFGD
jgi:hypothetical protein